MKAIKNIDSLEHTLYTENQNGSRSYMIKPVLLSFSTKNMEHCLITVDT